MKTEKHKLALKLANHSFAPSDAAEAVQTSHDARRLAQLVLAEPEPLPQRTPAQKHEELTGRLLGCLEDAEATSDPVGLTPGDASGEVDPLILAIRAAAAVLEERARVDALLLASEELSNAEAVHHSQMVAVATRAETQREACVDFIKAELAELLQRDSSSRKVEAMKDLLRFCDVEVDR